MTTDTSELYSTAKLRWACRRGMLELDVLLLPFIDDGAFEALPADKKMVFQRLLSCDDPDLFAWFMGHQKSQDPALNDMVQIILRRVRV